MLLFSLFNWRQEKSGEKCFVIIIQWIALKFNSNETTIKYQFSDQSMDSMKVWFTAQTMALNVSEKQSLCN